MQNIIMLHYIWVRFWFLVFRSFVQLYYRWALQYVLSSWCSRYCSKKWLIKGYKKAIVVFIYGYFSDQIKPLVSNLVSLIKLVNELRTDLILQTTLCPPYFQEKNNPRIPIYRSSVGVLADVVQMMGRLLFCQCQGSGVCRKFLLKSPD